jgi:phosphate-selective porin OprO/OprP
MNANTTASVHSDNVGLEAIAAYNNFKLQGEYSSAFYKANSNGGDQIKADVDTWYAEALWIMTGEKYSDAYKKGAFGLVKPKNEFTMDTGSGLGLWEIGVRMDAFDVSNTSMTSPVSNGSVIGSRFQGAADMLDSKKTTCAGSSYTSGGVTGTQDGAGCGGGAKSYTASIKWVMNPNMLIKANWTHTKFDNEFAPIDLATSRSVANTKPIDTEDLLMVRGQWMF